MPPADEDVLATPQTIATDGKYEDADIVLKPANFEEVRHSIARANVNVNTIKQYCRAYAEFTKQVKTLPCPISGKSYEVSDRYIMRKFEANPKPGILSKVNQAMFMLKILHPNVFVSLNEC